MTPGVCRCTPRGRATLRRKSTTELSRLDRVINLGVHRPVQHVHATQASGSAGSAPAKSGRDGTSLTHSVPIRGYAR
jgi:hypothetical protein